MKYGHFDDRKKEYVIDRPDTPRSWSNYLGNTEYGAIITNNAGGYSFYKSAAQGRFTRLRFNAVPQDQPGRYLYLHDRDTADFWSASWQPVGKPLEEYKAVCRHGTAYTIISSEYARIETETTYFVPLERTFECWLVRVTNKDEGKRALSLFTYVEYACNWNVQDDLNNLQYTQYIAKMDVIDNIIEHGTNIHLPAQPDDFEEKDQGRHTFLTIVGADIKGYDTDREVFLGPYRTYANPLIVARGMCTNSLAVGDNPCGTLQVDMDLDPGESKEFVVLMGVGKASEEGIRTVQEIPDAESAAKEFKKVKSHWHNRLKGMTVKTPDVEFNSMMNMWSPFNCLMTYTWSRAASLIYAGARDGLAYRDTVQDFLGVLPTIADNVEQRLELMITGQVSTGGAKPVVKPFAHNPGEEEKPDESTYRSDDCLWLFDAIPAFVRETGNLSFYDKTLPYADKGKDTVLGHMKRAIEFNLQRSGSHGLPCGLSADWNDCLRLGAKGESVFVAFQLRSALKTFSDICAVLGRTEDKNWAEERLVILDENLKRYAWDGDWFVRALLDFGQKLGSRENDEGSIFLNPQTWSIISGHAVGERAEKAMNAVNERLATEFGLMVCAPPFAKTDPRVVRATFMNKGMKENAGIFCHIQGWAVIAEAKLGNGDRAFGYFRASMPAAFNDKADLRQIEPYVYCQSTHSKYSPRFGVSRVPWLSGSATWAYYAATQYILGIQPEYGGLRIDPCIPSVWKEFHVKRIFRQKRFDIDVINEEGRQKGVHHIEINGEEIRDNFIPMDKMKAHNDVRVVMG